MTEIPFLAEEHGEEDGHHAITRLSVQYWHGIHEVFASFYSKSTTLYSLRTGETSENFSLTSVEMDALTDAWTQFKAVCAVWETEEGYRKAHELGQEQARQAAVWREIYRLTKSVPGLEVVAGDGDLYTVLLSATNFCESSIQGVDCILEIVQYAAEQYNRALASAFEDEANGFPTDSSRSRAREIDVRKAFLAQHRGAQEEIDEPCKEVAQAQ